MKDHGHFKNVTRPTDDTNSVEVWFRLNKKCNFYQADKAKYASFAPIRAHDSIMHDGIRLLKERNQDLLVIQILCKFGSNQNKNKTSIMQTKNY